MIFLLLFLILPFFWLELLRFMWIFDRILKDTRSHPKPEVLSIVFMHKYFSNYFTFGSRSTNNNVTIIFT